MATSRDVARRARELRELIENHNYRYYVLDDPTIADAQFDALMRELQQLESMHPELADADSPTQRVGGQAAREFPEVVHAVPMLSLDNAFSEQDIASIKDHLFRKTHPLEDYAGGVEYRRFDPDHEIAAAWDRRRAARRRRAAKDSPTDSTPPHHRPRPR